MFITCLLPRTSAAVLAMGREYPHSAISYKSLSMCFREWMEGEGGKKVA
jgi:hypothetical protein